MSVYQSRTTWARCIWSPGNTCHMTLSELLYLIAFVIWTLASLKCFMKFSIWENVKVQLNISIGDLKRILADENIQGKRIT